MQLFWLAMKAGLVIALLLVVILVVKTRLEYRRRTYDPTVILVFQKQFDEMDEDNIRKDAANVCGRYLELPDTDDEKYRWLKIEDDDRDKLEPVLDFFEDLGFYLAGDQFSDEVTHHHFFPWIRGYYSILKPYIDYYRDKENEKATYVFIEQLYERVCEIEKTFPTVKLLLDTKIEKLEFLRDERQSGNAE